MVGSYQDVLWTFVVCRKAGGSGSRTGEGAVPGPRSEGEQTLCSIEGAQPTARDALSSKVSEE